MSAFLNSYVLTYQKRGSFLLPWGVLMFFLFAGRPVGAETFFQQKTDLPLQKARLLMERRAYDSALFYFQQAASRARQRGDERNFLSVQLQKAGCFLRMGETDSALRINEQVLHTSREKQYKTVEMISENALGQWYIRASRNGEALEHFTTALKLAIRLQDKRAIAFSGLNLGNTFTKLGLYQEAGAAYRKALAQTGNEKTMIRLKNILTRRLAFVLEKEGNTDSARLLLQDLPITPNGTSSLEQQARDHLARAQYLKNTGKAQQADASFQHAYEQAEAAGIVPVQMEALKNRATLALNDNRPDKAQKLARQALSLSRGQTSKPPLPDLYSTMYLAWKQKGNPDSALFYHEKLLQAQQRAYTEKQNENLADLRIKYQTDLTQKRLLQLKNETLEKDIRLKTRQMQVNTLLGGSFTLILVLALLLAFYFYKQKKNRKIRQQEREKLLLEKEAEAAQALVMGEEKERRRMARELHDGIGVLLSSAGMLCSNMEEQQNTSTGATAQKIRLMVEKAGTEVRRISHNLMPVALTRFGLKEALEDLFDDFTEKAALKTYFDISLSERLNVNMEFTIFRMVQELLHNTLKHSKADTVVFLLRRKEKTVFMNYRDNGVGFDTKKHINKGGIGLSGIRSRVEFLHGTCDLQSAPGKGFSVKISFPVS